MKYRVIQVGSKEFKIQIYGYEVKGFWWWKRKEWSWMSTNSFGGVWSIDITLVMMPSSGSFNSLKEAKDRISDWNFKPIVHE